MSTTLVSNPGLCILTGGRTPSRAWSGALARFFETSRKILDGVITDVRGGRLREPAFLFGKHSEERILTDLDHIMTEIDVDYPIDLHSPFEDTESISGGLWSGRELFGPTHEDGLAKLRFAAGTLDLPLHVHEHSDRFIAVLEGQGRFWWSDESWREFSGDDIRSTPVRTGDVLVFTRNLLHTFSAPDEDLLLLSYHSPEIPFDDPRQYTLPSLRWTPRIGGPQ
ncbi:MAG: cupin domain-containing protein [Phycisphaerales bacterium]|nr:cupin domain-containing protein [Phycisphaerales bacterium]